MRVHSDSEAAGLAGNVQARAFTVGQNIAFGTGQYGPDTSAGKRLLAHELAHVVQQGGNGGLGSRPPVIQRQGPARLESGGLAHASRAVQIARLNELVSSLTMGINALDMSPPDFFGARNAMRHRWVPYRSVFSWTDDQLMRANESIIAGQTALWGRGLAEDQSSAPTYEERQKEAVRSYSNAKAYAKYAFETVGTYYTSAANGFHELDDRAGPNMMDLTDEEIRERSRFEALRDTGLSIRVAINALRSELDLAIHDQQHDPERSLPAANLDQPQVGIADRLVRKISIPPRFATYMGSDYGVVIGYLSYAENHIIAGQTLSGHRLPAGGRDTSDEAAAGTARSMWVAARTEIRGAIGRLQAMNSP